MPMMTKQSCNTSDVLIGQPPFPEIRGQEAPPVKRATAYRIRAALKAVLSCAQHITPPDKMQQKRTAQGRQPLDGENAKP